MNVTAALLRLYPGSFRARWGVELEQAAQTAGWRAWPDLLTNAASMWLHPTLWPADSRAQRPIRATAAAFALTFMCWYAALGIVELDPGISMGTWRGSVLSLGSDVVVIGLLLIAPRPRIRWRATGILLLRTARHMVAPTALGGVVVLAANAGGSFAAALAPFAPTLAACWWLALALVAIQWCRALTGMEGLAVPPSPGRLKVGIKVLMTGVTVSGLVLISGSISYEGLDRLGACVGGALLTLNWAFTATSRDVNATAAD